MLEKSNLHHSQNRNRKTMQSSKCALKINQAIKIKT
jgi:hypothetical protein